ncbi:unnamed protein product [Linum trigynum]|uniref:TRAF-type domain-containing protein n=1 Tax=Linum trigynum TaxID=586398 RepID=A0AAV2EDJ5_9ROSI
MAATTEVDPPLTDVELVPEKETIEDVKEAPPAFPCQLSDIELVYKMAQSFLPGLATACVDNTTGGIFRTPGSVAAELRKEMIDYLTQRSETFVAESVILEGEPQPESPGNPFDIISDFVDDFASSKRNFFSRVSGWLLSEKREDKIDDFVQEMELNGFWPIDKRSTVAENLLKNVDLKNRFHCDHKFNAEEELAEHSKACGFRTLNCENEGCDDVFCASNKEDHDAICPFKIIPCEQNCSEYIMRRDMDRHCITVCPMKLVACPFYAVGCQANVPSSKIDQHRADEVKAHVLCVLQSIHKEASVEDLNPRVDQVLELSSGLAEARDVRSMTRRIKNIEAKLGPLEIKPRKEGEEASAENGEKAAEDPTADTTNKASEQVAAAATDNTVSKDFNEAATVMVSEETTSRAVENVSMESNKSADKVNEEPTEASKKPGDNEESTEPSGQKVNEAEAEAAEKIIDEPPKASTDLGKESTESVESTKNVIAVADSVEPADQVSEESTQVIHNLNKEPVDASYNPGKESTDVANKLGEERVEVMNSVPVGQESMESDETTKIVSKELPEAMEPSTETTPNVDVSRDSIGVEVGEEPTSTAADDVASESNEGAKNKATEEPTSTVGDADTKSSDAAKSKSEEPTSTV